MRVGDTVRVHYTCSLDDGTVFVSTRDSEPKEFLVGTTDVIPGLQDAVIGMGSGETKTVSIPPERAYGPYHQEMTAVIQKEMVPPELDLAPGVAIRVKHADGHESDVLVTAITEEGVAVDGNHPLAGKRLHMEIELVERKSD